MRNIGRRRQGNGWRRLAISATAILAMVTLVTAPLPAADKPATDKPAATQPAAGTWRSLFDGKSLDGWRVTDFGGHGEPRAEGGAIVLPFGETLTGVTYTGEMPKVNYEVAVDARRVDGSDFFCGITFPVKDDFASLIIGGWGGGLCGISSLDDEDAAHNETTTRQKFEQGRWYRVRLRVLDDRLQAWVDDRKIVDASTAGRKVSLRHDIEEGKPFSIASFQTTAGLKEIKLKTLTPEDVAAAKKEAREAD